MYCDDEMSFLLLMPPPEVAIPVFGLSLIANDWIRYSLLPTVFVYRPDGCWAIKADSFMGAELMFVCDCEMLL